MLSESLIKNLSLNRFLQSVAKVIGGNFLTSIISLVTSIFVARWTTPYDLGTWNLALLISVYVPVVQFGVFNGLNRQLPYFIGRGEKDTAFEMASVTYFLCLALAAVSAVITVGFAGYYWAVGQNRNAMTAISIGVIVTCLWPTQYLTVTYRTSSDFGRLAGRNSLVALIGVPLTLLVFMFGYVGLMARAATLAILGVVSLYISRPIDVVPKWNKSVLVTLARVGMPIWMLGQLGIFFLTLDRVVLADSPLTLGYFSISIQAGAFASMIPVAITMVVYPQMVQKYGETHDAFAARALVKNGALLATVLGGIAGVCGWFLLPYFVENLLPAYVPGIRGAQWACLTGLAMGMSVYNNVFNVIQRQDLYLVSLALGVVVFFTSWNVLSRFLQVAPLESAVQSMLAANFSMSCAALLLTRIACVQDLRKQARRSEASTFGQVRT